MRTTASILLTVLVAGCVAGPSVSENRRMTSSGQIGCAPSEIQVVSTGTTTWTATCKDKVFYCTAEPAACKAKI